jgi:serine/threonine protein phosphatase PrpC
MPQININGLSDIGKMREENQDSMGWHTLSPICHFFIVSDGMGGYAGGALASKIAVDTAIGLIKTTSLDTIQKKPELVLRQAINKANNNINKEARKNSEFTDMGATIVCCIVNSNKLFTAHIGDSRGYLIKKGIISQITEDHTVVQDLVRAGYVNSEDADYHPSSGILTKCLGQMEITDPNIRDTITLEEGDNILLCSDGLTGMLDDLEIGEIITFEKMNDALHLLIDLSNESGGFDNITTVICKYGHKTYQFDEIEVNRGNPLYIKSSDSSLNDPTTPFKMPAGEKLRDTMYLPAIDDFEKQKRPSWLFPIIISLFIILLGIIFWYIGLINL